MIYNMTKQIYSSEIGKNGYLKTLGLINLIQDCENLHINSLEKFNNFLNEHQVGVFLNYRQVHIIRRPEVLEWVKLKTWPYETKGFLGYRNTLMFDSNNRSEEHTLNSSHVRISYAVFCLKKKKK